MTVTRPIAVETSHPRTDVDKTFSTEPDEHGPQRLTSRPGINDPALGNYRHLNGRQVTRPKGTKNAAINAYEALGRPDATPTYVVPPYTTVVSYRVSSDLSRPGRQARLSLSGYINTLDNTPSPLPEQAARMPIATSNVEVKRSFGDPKYRFHQDFCGGDRI